MRRVARAGCAVMLSYLLQATVLPYLKVRGAQPELILVVLFGLGGALGMYGGLCAGLSAALILETVGGNIPVFSTVFCAGAGIFGAFVTKRLDAISLPGNRGRERMLRRYAPPITPAPLPKEEGRMVWVPLSPHLQSVAHGLPYCLLTRLPIPLSPLPLGRG